MSVLVQRSFSGGEIAPSLYARVDTVKYSTGLRTCRNFFIMRHGGASNRAATTFIGEVKNSAKTVRLIPFIFNNDQTYVLEFGDLYMRVIRNGAQQTLAAQAITNITNASPAVLTYSGADTYSNGDEVYLSGVVGNMANFVNNRNFKVVNVSTVANTFELDYMDGTNVDSTGFGSYTSGGTIEEVYTIVTPYVEADLAELQFVQSADVVTLVHPNYAPMDLSRLGHTSWTLAATSFNPIQQGPNITSITGTAGAIPFTYKVSAINQDNFEESIPSSLTSAGLTEASTANPHTITWTAASGANEYNVYKELNGVPGFIGVAIGTTFVNTGISPDTTNTPPTERDVFDSTNNYPSTVTYFQQRRMFANTNNDPEKVWASRSGHFTNFTTSAPLQDDDSITFSLAGRQVNEVKHLIDVGNLLSLTSGGEWSINGNSAGILTPTDINPKQYSYNGASSIYPLVIGGNALYIQSRGSIVRDLSFDYQSDGYRGSDLTIYSAHLFDGYTIFDWAYQQIPHSIVWMARGDGTLIGLTYVREQQMIAWHRHDFDGYVENVCSVPEGDEDAVYLVINRTVDEREVRYIERMATRRVDDIVNYRGMDCSLSYDGRNTNDSHTMTLSGSGWLYTDTLTLTSSTAFFKSSDIGNQIFLYGDDSTLIRFTINGFTSTTVVTGKPHKTVPINMRATAMNAWTRAVDEVTGLWHLEGKAVSVYGDSFVVASPNNESYDVRTVADGKILLDKPYGVIHIGLPITADIETLDIDMPQGETLSDKKKLINKVVLYLEKSRGGWMGGQPPDDDSVDPLQNLVEIKVRETENYDEPVRLLTETIDVNILSQWNSNGRIFIRQVDPLPISILAVAPAGLIPIRGG